MGWPRMAAVEPICTGRPSTSIDYSEIGKILIRTSPVANDKPRRRRVVGDHVGQGELEVFVTRVDDLHRRSDGLDRAKASAAVTTPESSRFIRKASSGSMRGWT